MLSHWQAFRQHNKICLRHTSNPEDWRTIALTNPSIAEELVHFINRHRFDTELLQNIFDCALDNPIK